MVKKLLDYVEIRTKITSIFAFLISIGLLLYKNQFINTKLTLIFFASMFLFDLTTTAINNYIGSKEKENILLFTKRTSLIIIYVLLMISTLLGLYLAYLTDIVVLLAGGICFISGVLYTYGPVPIARQPLGEILSGFFYGILIPFILFYINTPRGTFLLVSLNFNTLSLEIQIVPILLLFLFGLIPFSTTANIMLANNICDLDKDILVKRHTLPYYVGEKALYLFAGMYYLTYVALLLLVLFQVLSPICLLSIFTLFPVQRNISRFFKRQDKAVTFIIAIKNYIIIMGSNTLLIFISVLVNY